MRHHLRLDKDAAMGMREEVSEPSMRPNGHLKNLHKTRCFELVRILDQQIALLDVSESGDALAFMKATCRAARFIAAKFQSLTSSSSLILCDSQRG